MTHPQFVRSQLMKTHWIIEAKITWRPEAFACQQRMTALVFMGILIVRRRVASGKSRQIVNGNQRISYFLSEVSKLLEPIGLIRT